MESEEGNIKTEENVSCVHCKKTGLFTFDIAFMMHCNDCFVNKKEECKMEWITKMNTDLLPCEVCLESYIKGNCLPFHSCKREGINNCEYCGQQFYNRKTIMKHCKIVHNLLIDEHDSIEHSTEKFQYDKQGYCNSYSQNSSLVILPRTGEKAYKCIPCSKSFTQKPSLLRHIRCHTGEKPYQCSTCGKSFTQKSSLRDHIQCHTGDKPYQCSTCCTSFTKKANLLRHIRSHTGEKPYQCSSCCKSFTKKDNLHRHIRCHTGEKPYQCPTCSMSFTVKSSLLNHIRSHTGEKPYQCPTCNKSFTQKSNLIVHARSHTGEKPYQCPTCSKGFTHKSNLIIHIRCHK